MAVPHPLLNYPAFPAERYAPLADRLKRLLGTTGDLLFVQAEAILALEATAVSVGRPGLVALNIVTSPYGAFFTHWLKRTGAEVHEVSAVGGQPISVATVEDALATLPRVDLVAVTHGETSSGILNPLAEIAALAKSRGALLAVDAVASVGGHELDVDALGIDLCIAGPQKSLGGPAGLSLVTVSAAGWRAMEQVTDFAPSNLSLMALKRGWVEQGRSVPPGMPSAIEFWALEAALDQLEAEGLPARLARHVLAARASRAALRAMGIAPFVTDDAGASQLATAALVPDGVNAETLIAIAARLGVTLTHGFGEVRGRLVRLDHTGARAAFAPVLANIVAYGTALGELGAAVDIAAASAAVAAIYRA